MAYSPGPPSPNFPSSHLRGPSPPPASSSQNAAPLSKRDKRRHILSEKIDDLTTSFAQNRESHFRHYVKALQHEMSLILAADPYQIGPMEDGGEEIAKLVRDVSANTPYSTGMMSLAGGWYARFVQEVNAGKEEMDAELAMISKRHERALLRLEHERDFKMRFAEEEYKELSTTIRERLIQTITTRKAKLVREKEQLNVADTNALLLHPSQFSITNPASPGGPGNNRKTRHTRHRIDADDIANGFNETMFNKRKRKPLEEEIGSPARDVHYGVITPAERIKRQALSHQTAPLASINSLFTDKELTMHGNNAHVATVHFFESHKHTNQNGTTNGTTTNGNGTHNSDADDTSSDAPNSKDKDHPEDSLLAAPDMARTASQTYHMTRSSRTGGPGLNLLSTSDPDASKRSIPYYALRNHVPYQDRCLVPNKGVPLIPSLMPEEVSEDLAAFEKMADRPKGWVDKGLIEKLGTGLGNLSRFSLLHPDWPAENEVHLVNAEVSRSLREKEGK